MTTQSGIFDIPGILESEPKLSFFSQLNQQKGLSPNQRAFFENRFDSIFNQFTGLIGQGVQGSENGDFSNLPTFDSFINNFDFGRDFMSRPPSLRFGGGTARFAPPTQFRF